MDSKSEIKRTWGREEVFGVKMEKVFLEFESEEQVVYKICLCLDPAERICSQDWFAFSAYRTHKPTM